MTKLLSNNDHQVELEENGFLKLDAMDSKTIDELKSLVAKSIQATVQNSKYSNNALYASLHEFEPTEAQQIEARIEEIVRPNIAKYFNPVKFHFGNILIKMPGEESYTYPHQDWTFVDFEESRAVTVWIPLQDTDETNGTLGFIRGSHNYLKKPVGSPVRQFYSNCTFNFPQFYGLCDFIPVKTGEMLIFDCRTVHSAVPNSSNQKRIAISFSLTPVNSQLYHHILVSKDPINRRIAKVKVDREFFSFYSVEKAQELYEANQLPKGYEVEEYYEDTYEPYSSEFIGEMIDAENLKDNGKKLTTME